jgi:hypothetical protein
MGQILGPPGIATSPVTSKAALLVREDPGNDRVVLEG